jgi:anti-sigma factor RsiW
MTQCERLSERMPDVALGRAAWTSEEQAHLDACADCRAEWTLVQATAHLGDSLPRARDPEALTAAVLGRVAGEQAAVRTRRRTWLVAGLAAAAVAIIAVRIPRSPSGVGVPVTTAAPVPAPVAAVPTPTVPSPTAPAVAARQSVALPELDDLPDAELESILGSLDQTSGVSPSLDGSGFDNLDDHELERVLGAWEG